MYIFIFLRNFLVDLYNFFIWQYNLLISKQSENLEVRLLSNNAILPTKAHTCDAGWDLYTPVDFTLLPNSRYIVDIKIAITVPENTYGRIASRSGLAIKNGIDVLAGVIDRGYTDEISIILINHGVGAKSFKKGDRIAQLIVTKINQCSIKKTNILSVTSRGGGFGSTGN